MSTMMGWSVAHKIQVFRSKVKVTIRGQRKTHVYMHGGILIQLGANILHSEAENRAKIQVSMAKVKVTLMAQSSNKK
jgi:hypothetical protein